MTPATKPTPFSENSHPLTQSIRLASAMRVKHSHTAAPGGQTMREDVQPSYKLTVYKALSRMKRAHDRGTGCHLTAEMIAALSVTGLGEIWADPKEDDADV